MIEGVCQSCGRPFSGEGDLGFNADGSQNQDYCKNCFDNGEFVDPDKTITIAIEENISMAMERGIDKETAYEMANQIFPKLKRWRDSS